MESERSEATFEGLAAIPSELIEAEQNVSAEGEAFDASSVTHAMITPDGTTVPITLNPETGQFMTPDGQTVQVQMAEDEDDPAAATYSEESETVLPDQTNEEVAMAIEDGSGGTSFQVVEQPQTVVIKEENYSTPMIEQHAIGGNLQLVSSDGAMYLVSPEMAEAAPTLRIISSNEAAPIVEETSLHGGKIRIVNSSSDEPAMSPKKVVSVNQQQFTISQAVTASKALPVQEKPKVVIRPTIAPKTENKVQYVRVVGSKPIQQQQQQVSHERQVVRLTSSGGGMPILPRNTVISSSNRGNMDSNVLKIALPTSSNRQRIILPSESVKVVDAIPNRKVQVTMPPLQPITKIEPALPLPITPTGIEASKVVAEKTPAAADMFESTGVKPRKPCNCTKSQCLKLYCECFANGEFCNNCNCNNCFNNLAHEESRQRAIKQCLERNPNAFRPKIGKLNNDGERKHNKGCNCKRSGCLKNYCECYEAKIACTKNCRCIGCKNIEVGYVRKPDSDQQGTVIKDDNSMSNFSNGVKRIESSGIKSKLSSLSAVSGNAFRPVSGVKQPFNFVTNEVVEATCQCLLAQAEEAERNGQAEVEIEGLIIQEFGRCLSQIIDMANKS